MFAIDDPTAVAVLPTPEAAGTPGFFTEGNPSLGQAATYVRASWLNSLQQELLNILVATGVTPSKTAYSQLLTALRSNGLLYAVDTGSANTCVISYTPAVTALTDGMLLWFQAGASNTGASTLNVNGLGAKAIVGLGHSALQGGEIVVNGRCQVIWHQAFNSFVLIECSGAAQQVGAATKSGQAIQFGQATGRWINRQIITATATYTPTAGTNFEDVIVIAGGGGGGGSAPTGAGQMSAGAGGGGGGWARRRLTIAQAIGQTMTVGAFGAGGVLGSGAGSSGGASSFGALLSATGGAGGTFGSAITASNVTFQGSGGGGVGSNGDVNGVGGVGRYATYSAGGGIGGDGGLSYLGGGAPWSSGTSGGITGPARGSGGGGGVVQSSNATGSPGGNGGAGLIIIDEYA